MRRIFWIAVMVVVFMAFTAGLRAENGLEILTRPSGLVAGRLDIEVSLGAAAASSELFVDGRPICTLTSASSRCSVDLGPKLHVHLLELVRRDAQGGVVERVERWLNRPGYEADLEIQLAARPIGRTCGGRLRWSHPNQEQPVALEIEAAEGRWQVSNESRTFGYPCPEPGRTGVLAASVVFADGRRADASALVGSNGRPGGPDPEPVLLEPVNGGQDACKALESGFEESIVEAERGTFEVAFVLDPGVDYGSLAGLGWKAGSDTDSQTGSQLAWDRAVAAFSDADRLWFVAPDSSLRRVDGLAEGTSGWLGLLFKLGPAAAESPPRLADAVATAGLVAAAAPHRRAVVLIVGSDEANDPSRFAVEQVRAYLKEIGVPLFVVRASENARGPWPQGATVDGLSGLAGAFEAVRSRIDAQCVAWYPSETNPEALLVSLPAGWTLAGREPGSGASTDAVWRRAELVGTEPEDRLASEKAFEGESVEVTAVKVLVRASDHDGRPVTDLTTGDVEAAEDGVEAPVLELRSLASAAPSAPEGEAERQAPSAGEPRKIEVPVSIYVERQISGVSDVIPALNSLAERAEWLTSLGPVSVVVADRKVETILTDTRDAASLRAVLEAEAHRPQGQHAIERIRTNYLREIRVYPDRGGRGSDPAEGGTTGADLTQPATPDNIQRVKVMTRARAAIFEEDGLLRRTSERLTDWALSKAAGGPKLLMAVGLGFDEDPGDFYLPFIERQLSDLVSSSVRSEFIHYQQGPRMETVGLELAAAGWLVVPVATRTVGKQLASADTLGGDRFQAFLTATPGQGAYTDPVDFLMLDPLGPQKQIARPSGGDVAMGGKGIDRLIEQSSGWYQLTYQVARAPDGAFHDLQIESLRPGVELKSSHVVVSGTSEGRAAMRLRELLDDPGATGELGVQLALSDPRPGEGKKLAADLTVSVDLSPIAPLLTEGRTRALRFSFGVQTGTREPFIYHDLVTATGILGGMTYEAPIEWSKGPSAVAVVVEDLSSGIWGGTVVELEQQ